ncbi:MAG: fatty acid desaturase [Hyphomicrobiales bacterium]|nr:fatty acid desaturase [Hyphomicrobiales bacterium]
MNRNEWRPEGTGIVSRKDLKKYMVRNNTAGTIHFFLHLTAIMFTGYLLIQAMFTWWCAPLLILHGSMIAFLFAPMHECVHSSAFRTRSLNVAVGRIAGLIILRPFLYLKYRHMAHHTFTQHPQSDPDRVDFPRDMSEYLQHISSYNIWHRMLGNLFNLSLGRFTEEEREFIPQSELKPVANEARTMMLVYAVVLGVSVYFQSWLAVYLWLLPRILGEPALRAVRMIEHTGMAESPNMLENTRTTKSNMFVRFVYWNMPFHAEHHLYPSVPFHALPRLHTVVKDHLREVAPGVLSVHAKILSRLLFGRNRFSNPNNSTD